MAEGGLVSPLFRKLLASRRCGSCGKRSSQSSYRSSVVLDCKHRTCSECLLKQALIAVENKIVGHAVLQCPVNLDCSVLVKPAVFESLLEPWLFAKLVKFIEGSIEFDDNKVIS
jgi:hypothetical protein